MEPGNEEALFLQALYWSLGAGLLEDGRVIVYDFGCVKRLKQEFMTNYASMVNLVIADEKEKKANK